MNLAHVADVRNYANGELPGQDHHGQEQDLQHLVANAMGPVRRLLSIHSAHCLLLLEHEPVFTLGRNARRDNVLLSEEALRERGFDGATLRDIARQAQVPLGLLRYYFGGKLKLWQASVDSAFDQIQSDLAVPLDDARSDPDDLSGPTSTM